MFAALADPTRRRIVEPLVREGSTSVPALTAALPITRQAVAKHLATLGDAGLVERSPEGTGREVRYRLRAGALRPATPGSTRRRGLGRPADAAQASVGDKAFALRPRRAAVCARRHRGAPRSPRSTAARNSSIPNAPSSRAATRPSLPITNSHGSLVSPNARSCGRRPLLGSLST